MNPGQPLLGPETSLGAEMAQQPCGKCVWHGAFSSTELLRGPKSSDLYRDAHGASPGVMCSGELVRAAVHQLHQREAAAALQPHHVHPGAGGVPA